MNDKELPEWAKKAAAKASNAATEAIYNVARAFQRAEEILPNTKSERETTLEAKITQLKSIIEYQRNEIEEYKDRNQRLEQACTRRAQAESAIQNQRKNIIDKAMKVVVDAERMLSKDEMPYPGITQSLRSAIKSLKDEIDFQNEPPF